MKKRNKTIKIDNSSKTVASAIAELIQLLTSVELDTPEAKLNEISTSDGNGGRIFF